MFVEVVGSSWYCSLERGTLELLIQQVIRLNRFQFCTADAATMPAGMATKGKRLVLGAQDRVGSL